MLLVTSEAAEYVGLKIDAFRGWVYSKRGPRGEELGIASGGRPGRVHLLGYKKKELDRWLKDVYRGKRGCPPGTRLSPRRPRSYGNCEKCGDTAKLRFKKQSICFGCLNPEIPAPEEPYRVSPLHFVRE